MGLLDDFGKQLGGALGSQLGNQLGPLAGMATKNPRALAAVVSLLSNKDASVGGTGGLGGLVSAFQSKGLGDMMASWVSTGPNPAISAGQLTDVIGADTLKQFADKAGVPQGDAGGLLAGLLPTIIDQLTPQGQMPDAKGLEGSLGSLLKTLKL